MGGFITIMTIQYVLKHNQSLKWSSLVLLFASNNWLDMQVPVERLVEEETSLEVWYIWKPCQSSHRCKENDAHTVVVWFGKNPGEVPQPSVLYFWPHSLCKLKQRVTVKTQKKPEREWKGRGKGTFNLTKINPHPVGRKAREQMTMSFRDNSQTTDREIITDRTPRKRNALNSLNKKW